jgi:hypothetical protein
MNGWGTKLSCPLLILIMLSVPVTLVLAGGPSDGTRSDGDRATSIDGEHRDDFVNANNLTLWGESSVVDGELTIDREEWTDGFTRFPINPWVAAEGNPRISAGVLLTNGTETSNATARRDIDLHDLELQLDFSPGDIMGGGPVIVFRSDDGNLSFWYDDSNDEIVIGFLVGSTYNPLESAGMTMMFDQWYHASILIDGDDITFQVGPNFMSTTGHVASNFSSVELHSKPMESSAWDNVTLNRLGGSGMARTFSVDLPEDTYWSSLQINKQVPFSTEMVISLLDATDDQPIEGLEDITRQVTLLEDLIDPLNLTSVKLQVEMVGNSTNVPSIDSWKISWLGDMPRFIKPIPEVKLLEDEPPEEGVIDLRNHFVDGFTDKDNLTFSVPYMSAPMYVTPVVDGHFLKYELPTKDWHGTEYYKVSCSDGVLTVESAQATVVVQPVDDPPIVRPFGRVEMEEDKEFVFNMTPHLEDVDTPIEELMIRTLSFHATVEGQLIRLFYEEGNPNDRIEIEVSDKHNTVTVQLDVVVAEIDDPPVFTELDSLLMNEDVARTVDLASHLTDEDTPVEELVVSLPDGDEYISADGLVITLLYDDTGGEFLYTIEVSDGTTTVSQVLEVDVNEVNDSPTVESVGELELVDGRYAITIIEGDEVELPVVVVDEESSSFQYTVVSGLEGAFMVSGSLRLETVLGELGEYEVQVLISDGGASSMAVVDVSVVNRNDSPQDVAIASPKNNSAYDREDTIKLSGYALDPDIPFGEVLVYNWTSDKDGVLGTGKNLDVTNLSIGSHKINLIVDDGDITVEAWIRLTINTTGGGGNGGGGGGGNNGGGGVSDLPLGLILAILVVLGGAGAAFYVITSRRKMVEFSAPTEVDAPKMSVLDEEKPRPAPTAEPEAGPEAEAEAEAEPEAGPAPEAEPTPAEPEKAPTYAPRPTYAAPAEPVSVSYELVAEKETTLTEADLEEQRLDDLKRNYQNAIGLLDFGIPSPELQGNDWVTMAALLAEGEHSTLDNGSPITKIDGRWYHSDTEDLRTFLREVKEQAPSDAGTSDKADLLRKVEVRFNKGQISEETYNRLKKKYGG